MTRCTRLGVVVPAHNEAATIAACVVSIREAADATGLPYEVVVVCDACLDDTACVARQSGASTLRTDAHNVGVARAVGLGHLLASGADGLWLAMTDADSVVPGDWLTRMLAAAREGNDVILGTVRIVDWEGHPDGMSAAFDRHYAAGITALGHSHVHGANLGFSAEAYQQTGGIPQLALAEDHALVDAFHQQECLLARIPDLTVTTSARITGRATGGFADVLRSLRNSEPVATDDDVA